MTKIDYENLGSFENPVWNIFDALELAQDSASTYSGDSTIVVNIHLLKGDHYSLRDRGDSGLFYKKLKSKQNTNLNYFVQLQPLSCNLIRPNITMSMLLPFCTEEQITVYNK